MSKTDGVSSATRAGSILHATVNKKASSAPASGNVFVWIYPGIALINYRAIASIRTRKLNSSGDIGGTLIIHSHFYEFISSIRSCFKIHYS